MKLKSKGKESTWKPRISNSKSPTCKKSSNGKMSSLKILKRELSGKAEATNSHKPQLGCQRNSSLRVKTEKGSPKKKCSNLDRIMASRFKTCRTRCNCNSRKSIFSLKVFRPNSRSYSSIIPTRPISLGSVASTQRPKDHQIKFLFKIKLHRLLVLLRTN